MFNLKITKVNDDKFSNKLKHSKQSKQKPLK